MCACGALLLNNTFRFIHPCGAKRARRTSTGDETAGREWASKGQEPLRAGSGNTAASPRWLGGAIGGGLLLRRDGALIRGMRRTFGLLGALNDGGLPFRVFRQALLSYPSAIGLSSTMTQSSAEDSGGKGPSAVSG